MTPRTELLAESHQWWRIAQPDWSDPLDTSFAQRHGGRWNPPASFATLYLNEDQTTARANMQLFVAHWPYEPEDLRLDTALRSLGLPSTYPLAATGRVVAHDVCQPTGASLAASGVRGVRCRAGRLPFGLGRELAWFPATTRSKARATVVLAFESWFWN